jgi:non-ribosomal peptide synthetase component F
LQGGVAALLTCLRCGTDIPLGTSSTGRPEGLVGSFRNDLVLRLDTAGDPGFGDLVTRVRVAALAADAHRHLPFERLVAELAPAPSPARHPLFQVSLELDRDFGDEPRFPRLSVAEFPVSNEFDLDLSLTFRESSDARGLRGVLRYSADLFEHSTASRIAASLVHLLGAAAVDPTRPIGELPITEDPVTAGENR